MDPIAAIGLASSILTFIDFSCKLVSGTYEIAKRGSLTGNDNVELVVKDLNKLTEDLRDHKLKGISEHETALKELVSKCEILSGELLALLKTLKSKERFTWGTVGPHCARCARTESERQMSLLMQIENEFKENHVDLVSRFSDLQDTIKKALSSPANDEFGQFEEIQKIKSALDTLLGLSQSPSPEVRVLRQLYFKSMYAREDSVRNAECDTFKWIIDKEGEDTRAADHALAEQISESLGSSKDWMLKKIDQNRSLQSRAKSTFLKWLSSGNRIFHISGKAGSGKSTLMKLLASHPRTYEELSRWSGNKQLVFAQFFAWSAGKDDMQDTLHGLCRSILFTVLRQCPDLIPDIFPEAYLTLSKTQYERYIDEPLFRLSALKEGLRNLRKVSTKRGYRFCFFIDGLDEFKNENTPNLSHEDLNRILVNCAETDNVKLLVSSRPTDEFMSAFSNELRIKLHELTELDIRQFGCRKFEEHKSFASVKDCYLALVDKIVVHSRGVFLWAYLTTGKVLSVISRITDSKELMKLIDTAPKDIYSLYQGLLESIDTAYQEKVLKALYLVGNVRICRVLSLTWIDDLFTPNINFPVKEDIRTYSDEEIKKRVGEAEVLLFQTNGLLEIEGTRYRGETELACSCLQFFHRTVREFVDHSEQMRAFRVKFVKLDGIKLGIQMLLAELWFLKPADNNLYFWCLGQYLGNDMSEGDKDRHTWLDAAEKAIQYHSGNSSPSRFSKQFSGRILGLGDRGMTILGLLAIKYSHLHWVAHIVGDWEYLQRKLQGEPALIHANGDLSLLLSAILSMADDPTAEHLLDMGASINESVKLSPEDNTEVSIWAVFCTFLAHRVVSPVGGRISHIFCRRLRTILEKGVVDSEVFIILGKPWLEGEYVRNEGTHIISLKDLIQQFDPNNFDTWDKLFSPTRNIYGKLQNVWSYMARRRPRATQLLLREKYLPHRLGMKPEITPCCAESYLAEIQVYSVMLGNVTIMARDVSVRVS
ncbi:hypothetical protein F5Y13DRAFT_202975 [Hypoxylon sp. FL1857]|nr:hypothetical protein F5Y13DRAFT_202975 [Hypoxylon sp. FL1857]